MLSQQSSGDIVVAAHVGQALLAALEQIRQLAVIQAEQLQDRGVQVVDVDAVLDGAEAELVGGADRPGRPSRRRRPARW